MRHDPSQAVLENLDRRRGHAARLVQFAAHLSPSDRALVESIYDRGLSSADLARAAGTRPRAIRARVNRLVQRVSSPAFLYVLSSRPKWPPQRRQIAEAVFLRGECQREAAAKAKVSIHQVRREVDRILAVAEHGRS